MKKIIILFLVMMPFLFMSNMIEASGETYDVTFTTRFDTDNSGAPMIMQDKSYGSKVSFDNTNIDSEVYRFVFWIIDGVVRSDLDIDHEFFVTKNMTIEAIFSPNDEYAAIFMDTNGKIMHIAYAKESGDFKISLPTIDEYPSKPNYVLAEQIWDTPMGEIEADTIYTLQYELDTTSEFELTIDGDVTSYLYNSLVTVVAEDKVGQQFHYWTRDGKIVSYDQTIKVSVLEDTELVSVYGASPVIKQPVVYLSEAMTLRAGYNSHVGQFYLPEGYELVEVGMITIDGLYQGFELSTVVGAENELIKLQVPSYSKSSNEFLMSFISSKSISVRAYLVYEHNDVVTTVYSEVNPYVELTYTTPTFFGSPFSNVTAKLNNVSVLGFTVYLDNVSYATTTNGTVVLPNGFPAERMVVVINGILYPVEVK